MADPEVRESLEVAGATASRVQVPLLLDGGRNMLATVSLNAGLLEAVDASSRQRGLIRSSFPRECRPPEDRTQRLT